MSEQTNDHNYIISSGPLRSAITIELHTHRAVQLWQGRSGATSPDGKIIHPIISMPRFLSLLNIIRMDSSLDNPCADAYMLRVEERLLAARQEMNELIDSVRTVFNMIPETMTVENCLSVQPVSFPVFSASQLGFIGIYLLTDFDKLARNTQLATHMALLNRVERNDLIQRSSNLVRSIFVLAQKYRRIPVTRDDFRQGNVRAQAAQEIVGQLSDDILDGSRRSQYAPPLRRQALSGNAENTPVAEIPRTAAVPSDPDEVSGVAPISEGE